MMHKKGVTLITLIITVMILSIITATVIFNTAGIVAKSERVKFAEEIELIEDKIEEYYIATGTYPVLTVNTYTAEQIVDLNNIRKKEELAVEITRNKDEDSKFYLINFESIDVTIEERGIENTQDDIYVVSENNNVYYVHGFEIEEEVYFSLINISNMNKLD